MTSARARAGPLNRNGGLAVAPDGRTGGWSASVGLQVAVSIKATLPFRAADWRATIEQSFDRVNQLNLMADSSTMSPSAVTLAPAAIRACRSIFLTLLAPSADLI
ncbi:hypothetical protein SBA3_600002 [Candidatus Sulfopaludibacter sp. SbA3]|nr:hypothetical protein SBA3_600002 [Candidatus Sulfopaludibacter sp. SbA3]